MEKKLKKTGFIFLILVTLFPFSAFPAEDRWVMGGMEFSLVQKYPMGSVESGVAKLMPQLILSRISTETLRNVSAIELTDRKLESLRTQRLSLLLQLSSEIQKRDAFVLSESDSRKLKKKIADQEKSVEKIQKLIDENLEETEKIRNLLSEYADSGDEDKLERKTESVDLYGSSSDKLFVSEEKIGTREFEKAVSAQKINGLVTGSIVVYGSYFSVTAELRVFPGNRFAGTFTEVGSMKDIESVAANLTQSMLPAVANASKINLHFDIKPENAKRNARILIDGVPVELTNDVASVFAGKHSIEVSCEGFDSYSTEFDFRNHLDFYVQVPMLSESDFVFPLRLKNSMKGKLFVNGEFVGDVDEENDYVFIKGRRAPILGQFIGDASAEKTETDEENVQSDAVQPEETKADAVQSDDENINTGDADEREKFSGASEEKKTGEKETETNFFAFFFVPEMLQEQNVPLMYANPRIDNTVLIDRRRKAMYRGYSALIVSLPFTFYSFGNFNVEYDRYKAGLTRDAAEVNKWNTMRWVSIGVTVAAGGCFVFELVRYLRAANSVLPQKVKNDYEFYNMNSDIEVVGIENNSDEENIKQE